jgi:plastocyanin
VILWLSEASRRRGRGAGWRRAFRTVLFLAVPLVGATGFFGGAMVYGLHAYDWNPPRSHAGGEDDAPAAGRDAAVGTSRPATTPAGAAAAAVTVTVTMTDDATFKPASVTVAAGGTVRWVNASKDVHTVTDDPKAASNPKDVATPAGARPFNSGKIAPGRTFEQRFTVPGTYRYVCEPHEAMDMKGQVVVTGGP